MTFLPPSVFSSSPRRSAPHACAISHAHDNVARRDVDTTSLICIIVGTILISLFIHVAIEMMGKP